jgi:N-acyl-L-homoserine lactone synthetase
MFDGYSKRSANPMNIGISEILILAINVILVLGIPIIIIVMGIFLFRRLRRIETRLEKLEARQNEESEKKLLG